jgi:hypothetical protein
MESTINKEIDNLSLIVWKKGKPREEGHYLVTTILVM